ncbi:OsmC family protein [Cumulibacter manganitolerans]|uniref:OsmC family protein n=1 Tax=Cumulibacter manganitolerans TaxID=1884992 RepID=UPI001E4A25AF|nr:OsmC family protein [Cumulibacter manganitolerans]
MSDESRQAPPSDAGARSVTMERVAPTKFTVTNERGGQITTGSGSDADFMPGELLLAAIGACTGVDLDILVSRRAEPLALRIEVGATKVRDELGSRLTDIVVTYDGEFPEGSDGDEARAMVPKIVARSREKLCTVGRTVEVGTPISDVITDQQASNR